MDNVTEAASSPDRSPESVPTLLTANPASPSQDPAPAGSDALEVTINPGTPNPGTTEPASPPVESPVSPPSPPKAKGPVFPWPFAATQLPTLPPPLQSCSPQSTSQPPTSQPTPSLCQSNTQQSQHRGTPSPSGCCQSKLYRCPPSPTTSNQSTAQQQQPPLGHQSPSDPVPGPAAPTQAPELPPAKPRQPLKQQPPPKNQHRQHRPSSNTRPVAPPRCSHPPSQPEPRTLHTRTPTHHGPQVPQKKSLRRHHLVPRRHHCPHQRNPWDRHQTTCDGQRNPPSLHQSTCDGQRNPWDRHQTTYDGRDHPPARAPHQQAPVLLLPGRPKTRGGSTSWGGCWPTTRPRTGPS